eukprot:gene14743-20790_t
MPGAMQVFPVCQSEPFLEVVQRRISDHAKRLSRHVVMRVNRINWADVSNRGAALVVLSTLVVGLGAFLYHFASGSSWGDSVFNVYSILFNVPGASVTEEERGVSTLVLNLIFLAGLLVFAVLIGMVSEEIGGRLLSIRNGEGPLTLKGHILLLNWNSQIDSIIKQLNIAQKFKTSGMHDQAIVVLANMDRDEMLMSMNELLKKKKMKAGSDIYCRKGRPYRLQDLSLVPVSSEVSIIILLCPKNKDLSLVSVSEASIIILLCPENTVGEASAETLKAATIATLSTMTDFSTQSLIVQTLSRCAALSTLDIEGCHYRNAVHHDFSTQSLIVQAATIATLSTMTDFSTQSLIVQVPNEVSDNVNHVNLVQDLFASNGLSGGGSGGMRIVRLSEQSVIDRLVAQSSLQPGLCTIYENILRHGKEAEFVWVEANDDLRGKFSCARKRFPDAVTLGYISSYDGELHLNPGDSDIVTPGDKFILLCRGYISSYDGELHLNPGDSDIVTLGDKFILLCRGGLYVGADLVSREEGTAVFEAAEAQAEEHVSSLRGHNVGADPVSLEAGTAVFEAAEAQAEDRVSSLCASVTSSRKVLVLGWAPEDVGELVAGFAEFSPPGTELHPDLNKYIQRTLGRQNNHNRALLSQRTIAPSRPLQASLSRTRGSNSSLGYSLPSLSRGPTMTRRSEMSNYDFQTQNPFDDEDRDSGAVSPKLTMKLSAGSGSTAPSVAFDGAVSPRLKMKLSVGSGSTAPSVAFGAVSPRQKMKLSAGSGSTAHSVAPGAVSPRPKMKLSAGSGSTAHSVAPAGSGSTAHSVAPGGLSTDSSVDNIDRTIGRYPDRGRVSISGADKGLVYDMGRYPDRGRVSLSGADKGLLSDKESQWDRSVDCSARNSMNNPSSTLRLSPRSSVVNGGIVGQLPPQHSNMLASENLGGSLKEINSGGSNNPMAVNFSVGNVSFKFKVHKDPMGEEAMRIGKVDRADSVIIGLPTTIPYPYSDSQIQNIAAETSHQVHVVAKVNNSNTKKVAKKFFENMMRRCVTFELLISSQITSAILTQVAWQPSYIMIMEELLVSSEGMEMYLVEPSRLGFNKGETITFAEVTESARALSYTAMGYCKKSRTAYAQVLAPPASKLIRIEAGDKFILLAEEWD